MCFFLAKYYAGKAKYFRKENIPLTVKELKQSYPNTAFLIFNNAPTSPTDQNQFIKKAIKKNKNSFLFYLRGGLSRAIKTKIGYKYEQIGLHHALLPLIHKKAIRYELDHKVSDFFLRRVWQAIAEENNEIIISYDQYRRMIIKIASIISDINDKEILLAEDYYSLNKAEFTPADPISEFVYSFLYEFKEHLKSKKLCGVCPICRIVFPYKYNKIYCSYKCNRRRQYRDYYQKYRFRILPKKIKEMREERKPL